MLIETKANVVLIDKKCTKCNNGLLEYSGSIHDPDPCKHTCTVCSAIEILPEIWPKVKYKRVGTGISIVD